MMNSQVIQNRRVIKPEWRTESQMKYLDRIKHDRMLNKGTPGGDRGRP